MCSYCASSDSSLLCFSLCIFIVLLLTSPYCTFSNVSLLRFFQCVLIVFLPIFVILFLLMSTVFSRCFLLFATHYYPLRSLFHSLLYSISKVFQMVLFTAFSLSTPVILFFHYILCSLFICVLLHSFVNCFFYNRLTSVMLTSWISVSCAFLVLSPL